MSKVADEKSEEKPSNEKEEFKGKFQNRKHVDVLTLSIVFDSVRWILKKSVKEKVSQRKFFNQMIIYEIWLYISRHL